ncbi:MAG: hypothetical protein ABR502_03890 [Chitinophagaceae bacterium]
MKSKRNKSVDYSGEGKLSKLKESPPVYQKHTLVKDFTFNRFKKLYQNSPFSLKDWAGFLHLSERTLLRYSKENKNFEGIYADRILLLESLFNKGKQVFKSEKGFFEWMHTPKKILGTSLNVASLTTTQGIIEMERELGRMQYGVYV